MSEMDQVLLSILKSPLNSRDLPTETHYTLEALAFWKDDFLDAVRTGLHRKLIIGGLRKAGRINLAVELEPPWEPYVAAYVRGPTARIICPVQSEVGLRGDSGPIISPIMKAWPQASFPAKSIVLGFNEQFGFKVGSLSFLFRFVHREGRERTSWDWIPAGFYSGYLK